MQRRGKSSSGSAKGLGISSTLDSTILYYFLLSAVPSFATKASPKIYGLELSLWNFSFIALLGMHHLAFLSAERLRHVLKVFATLSFSFRLRNQFCGGNFGLQPCTG